MTYPRNTPGVCDCGVPGMPPTKHAPGCWSRREMPPPPEGLDTKHMGISCCQTTDAAETLRTNAAGEPEFALYLNEPDGPKVWITCVACPACGAPTSAVQKPEPPARAPKREPLEAPKELAAARAIIEERNAEIERLNDLLREERMGADL